MDYCVVYIGANGAVMVLVLAQLLRIERRMGCGDSILSRIKKNCPLFNGRKGNCKERLNNGEKKDKKEEMGQDRSP